MATTIGLRDVKQGDRVRLFFDGALATIDSDPVDGSLPYSTVVTYTEQGGEPQTHELPSAMSVELYLRNVRSLAAGDVVQLPHLRYPVRVVSAVPAGHGGLTRLTYLDDVQPLPAGTAPAIAEYRDLPGRVAVLRLAPAAASLPTREPEHNHRPLPFGRKLPEDECLRCDCLRAGTATARTWGPSRDEQDRRDAAERARAIKEHDCSTADCGLICTFGDW